MCRFPFQHPQEENITLIGLPGGVHLGSSCLYCYPSILLLPVYHFTCTSSSHLGRQVCIVIPEELTLTSPVGTTTCPSFCPLCIPLPVLPHLITPGAARLDHSPVDCQVCVVLPGRAHLDITCR